MCRRREVWFLRTGREEVSRLQGWGETLECSYMTFLQLRNYIMGDRR